MSSRTARAREPELGYQHTQSELVGLGVKLAASTVRATPKADRVEPAPKRLEQGRPEFPRAQAASILECDFLALDRLFVKRLYVLYFIELTSRRVHLAAITTNPIAARATQQARTLLMQLDDDGAPCPRILFRDHKSKFTREVDEVFRPKASARSEAPLRAVNRSARRGR